MKKILLILLSIAAAAAAAVAVSACDGCGGGGEEHVHTFNMQVAREEYLKSKATCQRRAQYYYSCECGEKSGDSFEYGEFGAHDYSSQNTEAGYLKSPANCTESAKYFYSCSVCGEKGEESFAYGQPDGHRFDGEIAEAKYLKLPASCTQSAQYFYSCSVCGEKDEKSFYKGFAHTFSNGLCTVCGRHEQSGGLSYNKLEGFFEVSGGDCKAAVVYLPDILDGLPVSRIAAEGFKDFAAITSLEISDNITSVGVGAFEGCTSILREKDGVTYTGNWLLACGEEADGLPVENTTVGIADGAFENLGDSKIFYYVIPDSVKYIGANAYAGCPFASLTLGSGTKIIHDGAFDGCLRLFEICNRSELALECGSTENGSVAARAKNIYTPSGGESKLLMEIKEVDGKDYYYFYFPKEDGDPNDVIFAGLVPVN